MVVLTWAVPVMGFLVVEGVVAKDGVEGVKAEVLLVATEVRNGEAGVDVFTPC